MLFLRFPHVSEVYNEKLTVSNGVPPFSLTVPNRHTIPAYPGRVLKGFPACFQLVSNVQGLRGQFVNARTS